MMTIILMMMHQAKRSNMADLAAKDGSQETLVNLVALCVNLALLPLVSDTPHLSFLLFLVLASLHIYSNFRAVSCLVFTSLNSTRLHLLLNNYKKTNVIQTPSFINRQEPVLRPGEPGRVSIRIGVSVNEVKHNEVSQVQAMVDNEDPSCTIHRGSSYLIIISNLATPVDIYRAYIQCYLKVFHEEKILELMAALTAEGWDLQTMALNTEGFSLQYEL